MHENYTMEKRRKYPYMACHARNNVTVCELKCYFKGMIKYYTTSFNGVQDVGRTQEES